MFHIQIGNRIRWNYEGERLVTQIIKKESRESLLNGRCLGIADSVK